MAEAVRFELTRGVNPCRFSSNWEGDFTGLFATFATFIYPPNHEVVAILHFL